MLYCYNVCQTPPTTLHHLQVALWFVSVTLVQWWWLHCTLSGVFHSSYFPEHRLFVIKSLERLMLCCTETLRSFCIEWYMGNWYSIEDSLLILKKISVISWRLLSFGVGYCVVWWKCADAKNLVVTSSGMETESFHEISVFQETT